jgi:hypothetical protein
MATGVRLRVVLNNDEIITRSLFLGGGLVPVPISQAIEYSVGIITRRERRFVVKF